MSCIHLNAISTGLMLVEIFRIQNPSYHSDFYDELKHHVGDIERLKPFVGLNSFCLEVMSRYLSSSINRFKFAKKFVTFCKELSI